MDATTWLVLLYVVAFLLEAAGLALVVVDIRDDRVRAREIGLTPGPSFRPPRGRPVVQKRGPNAGIDTEGRSREAHNVRAAEQGYSATMGAVLEILTGSLRRRAIGAALIFAGLAFGMAGNVVSLYWS